MSWACPQALPRPSARGQPGSIMTRSLIGRLPSNCTSSAHREPAAGLGAVAAGLAGGSALPGCLCVLQRAQGDNELPTAGPPGCAH